MTCISSEQLQAYYDGELPVSQRPAIEAHLGECANCRRVIAELGALSAMIADAPMAREPMGMTARLNDAWDQVSERGVLRITGWMTAAAAAVLVGAILHVPDRDPATEVAVASPAVWQSVAIMSPEQVPQDPSRADMIVLAQFMADDLSTGEKR